MMLFIDIGNTRVKWAAARASDPPGQWAAAGAAPRAEIARLAEEWKRLSISHAIAANVAGRDSETALHRLLSVPVEWFASASEAAGVRNGYRDPAQLGCDRFAAAIGAHALFPARALVVANCGTATTIDALTEDGAFIGGLILPGWRLMREVLARGTARLPLVAGEAAPDAIFADNTDDAIRAGCLAAQAGAIERAFAEHAKRHPDALCVLSGGAAGAVAPHLRAPHTLAENLVLTGLHAYAAHRPPARPHHP